MSLHRKALGRDKVFGPQVSLKLEMARAAVDAIDMTDAAGVSAGRALNSVGLRPR